MPNMNLNANSDWKQIGEAGADSRLMINKKNPHISSFFFSLFEYPKTYQYEKCAALTRETIHHCSYWISHIKTPIWKSYRLITQSDWKLRKIHLLPINVYHGLVHLDGLNLLTSRKVNKPWAFSCCDQAQRESSNENTDKASPRAYIYSMSKPAAHL